MMSEEEQMPIHQVQASLREFTDAQYQQVLAGTLILENMQLQDLRKFLLGLTIYYTKEIDLYNSVEKALEKLKCESYAKKKRLQIKQPTTAEKAQNWWSAVDIIILCLTEICLAAFYINQIQSSNKVSWLKYILISTISFIGVFMIGVIIYIWPRRDIRLFEHLFQNEDQLAQNTSPNNAILSN